MSHLRQGLRDVHTTTVRALVYLPEKRLLISADLNGSIVVRKDTSNYSAGDVTVSASSSSQTVAGEKQNVTGSGSFFQAVRCLAPHKGPVYAICAGHDNTFFSAGKDGAIVWSDAETGNTIQNIKTTHRSTINSLAFSTVDGGDYLSSGSWDATVNVFKRDGDVFSHVVTLSGEFKFAVTVCIIAELDVLVTGSQDGRILVWKLGQWAAPVQAISAHADIVRGFAYSREHSILFSVSNDGCISKTDFSNYRTTNTVQTLSSREIHSTFIFSLALWNQKTLITGCEDGTVGFWECPSLKSLGSITLESTAWSIAPISPEEFATGEDIGVLNVWTSNSKHADFKAHNYQISQVTKIQEQREKDSSSIDINKLPLASETHRIRGNRPGQNKLFRDGAEVVAFCWNGNEWERVGTVVTSSAAGSIKGSFYQGDDFFPPGTYDYIFEVDLEGCDERKSLPYRVGESTLSVAERFCAREGTSRTYVPEIEAFIRTHTAIPASQHEASSNCFPSQEKETATSPTAQSGSEKSSEATIQELLTSSQLITFGTWNLAPLKESLLKANTTTTSSTDVAEIATTETAAADTAVAETLRLSPVSLNYLCQALDKLKDPARFQCAEFLDAELDVIFGKNNAPPEATIIMFPASHYLPVIDLWRILALHSQVRELFTPPRDGVDLLKRATAAIANEGEQYDETTTIAALRFIANLHNNPKAAEKATILCPVYLPALGDTVKRAKGRRSAQIHKAASAVLYNTALTMARHAIVVPVKTFGTLLSTIEGVKGFLDSATQEILSEAEMFLKKAPHLAPLRSQLEKTAETLHHD